MALQELTLPVEFSQGLDTKTDPKRVVTGKLLALQNGVFKGKQIVKRFGYDVLGADVLGGGTLSSSQGATTFGSELLQYSVNTLYSYSTQTNSWASKGSIYPIKNTNTPVVRTTYQQSVPDMAINQGIAAYAYEDTQSGGVNLTVIDTATGAVLQNNVTLDASGLTPRCVVLNNYIFILYVVGVNLKLRILNVQTPNTIGSATNVVTDVHGTNKYFDAQNFGNTILFCYCTSTGTNQIKVGYLLESGAVGSPTSGYPNVATIAQTVTNTLAMALNTTTGVSCICYSNGVDGLSYTALNSDFTVRQSHTSIDSDTTTPALRIAPYMASSTQLGLFYEKATASGFTYDHLVRQRTTTIVGGGGSSTTVLRSAGLASRAFQIGTDWLVSVVHDSTLQATYFLIKTDGTIISKMMADQAAGLPAKHVLPSVLVDSASKAYMPAVIKTKFVSQGNTTFTLNGLSLETMDFGDTSAFIAKEISRNLLISGGMLQAYDGATLSEAGFHFFPENVSYSAGTSGSMATGTYEYFVVYAWIDRFGQMHRSAPSIGTSVAVTGPTGSVTLTIPTLRLTAKSNVMIEIYRTQANMSGLAYMVSSATAPSYNQTGADTVPFTDPLADASIAANTILYTSGGVFDNDAPHSGYLLDVNKNRALYAGLEDELVFGYSKQAIAGEGISFSDSFTFRVDPLGGAITAIKFMDDKIVVFKKSHIFYVAGDGPDDTGNNNNFTPPTLVTSDVGCVDPKSCVLTPMGIMFKTAKGIYLLDRSLSVQYIGADVEAYNSYTISEAVLMDEVNQVRFVTSDTYTLVYDYFYGQWGVFTNHGGVGAAIWNGTFVYARSNGQVYQQSATSYLDGATPFTLKIRTSWLKVAGLQGYQRTRHALVLGDYLSNHKLRIQVGYDYEPFFTDSFEFDAASVLGSNVYGQSGVNYGSDAVYGGLTSGVYQFRIDLRRQKCQAIQLEFEDVQNSVYGAAYSLSDLSLAMGFKPGAMRLPATKKVG